MNDAHHAVSIGHGIFQLCSRGHLHGDTHHSLVHLWNQNHIGTQAADQEKDHHRHRDQAGHQTAAQKIGQQIFIFFRELPHDLCPAGLLLCPLKLLKADRVFIQQEVAHQRNEGQGNEQGREDQKDHRKREVQEHHSCHTSTQANGQEYRNGG